MEDLAEFVIEFLFELPFEMAMESRRLKTWVKTTVFCVLCGAMTCFFAFLTYCTWSECDMVSGIFCALFTVGFLIFTIFGAILGHRRHWKNP